MKLVLASNNKNKLDEIIKIMQPLGYEVISQLEAGIDIDIEETGVTFEENALLKAREIYKILKLPVIADDSGLEVDYLNGKPGVYSHRYAGENANDREKCEKILSELAGVHEENRTARFVAVIVFIDSNGEEYVAKGTCEGKIAYEMIGENGFGYDPIFIYNKKSFAEISQVEKNKVSHRSNALKNLINILRS